jgi:P-type conjugative transfer protein TrbJ
MTRRKVIALTTALLVLLALISPPRAHAVTFVDLVAYAQRIITWYQKVEDLYQQAKQLEALYRQLESYAHGGSWSDLNGMLGALEDLFNSSSSLVESLGYTKIGIERVWRETFPGTLDIDPADSQPELWRERMDKAHETYRLIMQAINRVTVNNTRSQALLAEATAASKEADGTLEEIEVANMFNSLQTTELNKLVQVAMLQANAQTLEAALQAQQEASAQAARRYWLNSNRLPGLDRETTGYTGVPSL